MMEKTMAIDDDGDDDDDEDDGDVDDHEHDSDDDEEEEEDDVKVSVTERSSLVVGLPGGPLPLSCLDINNSQDH